MSSKSLAAALRLRNPPFGQKFEFVVVELQYSTKQNFNMKMKLFSYLELFCGIQDADDELENDEGCIFV